MFKKVSLLIFTLLLFFLQINAQEETYTLVGNINGQLVTIDAENAETIDLAVLSDNLEGLSLRDITFSKKDNVFYGILGNNGANPPFSLCRIEVDGQLQIIGELILPNEIISLCESISYNMMDGQLYSSASLNGGISIGDFSSESIIKINPTDASCELITTVDLPNTFNDDVDQMAFVGNDLYLHDGTPGVSSNFYKIDFRAISSSVTSASLLLSDRYYNAGGFAHKDGELYFPTIENELYKLTLETNTINYVGQTHDETQYNGERIRGIDFLCDKIEEEGIALVQLIHNIHDQRASLTVDGQLLIPRAKYRSASKFIEVEAGTYDIELNPVGEGYESLVQTITIRPNQSYILMAHGTFDNTDDVPVEISVLENAETAASQGEVALQFFHGGFDAPDVDLSLEEEILFDDVTYGTFAGNYQYLPADHYPFVLTSSDDETALGTYGAKLRFRGGQSGLIFASGDVEEGSFGLWMALNNGRVFPLIPLSNASLNRENLIFLSKPAIQTKATITPNPARFNNLLQIELLKADNVNIFLLDTRGQVVEMIFEGYLDAGHHNFEQQLTDLLKGLYFYEIQLNGERMTKRFIVK